MAPPPPTAAASLYRSISAYPGIDRTAIYRTQCDIDYADCVTQADIAYDNNTRSCGLSTIVGSAQQRFCYQQATDRRTQDVAGCNSRGLLCGPGEECRQSPVPPGNWRCCPPGYQACGGAVPACVPECPPGKQIAPGDSTCTCACLPPPGGCPYVDMGLGPERIDPGPGHVSMRLPARVPPTYLQDQQGGCVCYCPPGTLDCDGSCVPLGTKSHCSDCFDQCLAGWDCCDGQCEWIHADTRCGDCTTDCTPSGRNCCRDWHGDYTCVDLQTDVENCGVCGNRCYSGYGFVCMGGQCVCARGTTPCGSQQCCRNNTCCHMGGRYYCSDLDTDSDCGSCGTHCTLNERCCPGPTGVQYQCSNVQTDPMNCGSCGHLCAANESCCSGHCADTQTDEANCGTCGHACPSGWQCCGGVCKNIQTDAYNCGECSKNCTYSDNSTTVALGSCAGGLCHCPSGFYWVDHTARGDEVCCRNGYYYVGQYTCCPNGQVPAGDGWCCPNATPHHCGPGNAPCAATAADCP